MDLEKLTPAPWSSNVPSGNETEAVFASGKMILECIVNRHYQTCEADAEFIALARNAFDVMMRRKWWVEPIGGGDLGWAVFEEVERDGNLRHPPVWMEADPAFDPFTALVEADKWYKANVEKR